MRTKYIFSTLYLCLCFFAEAQNGLLIFVDKSASTGDASRLNASHYRKLKPILMQHLKESEDWVSISYLFNNSASPLNSKTYKFQFWQSSSSSSSRRNLRKTLNQSSQYRVKSALVDKILADLPIAGKPASRSNILESVATIARAKHSAKTIHILYLSDMEEFSDRRRFVNVSSMSQAIKFAQDDAKKLRSDFGLQGKLFNSVEIQVFYPPAVLDGRRSLVFSEQYWRTIFYEFFGQTSIEFTAL